MASTRTFRKPKSGEEEKQMLENAVPKSTRSVNKWSIKIFSEWQATRLNKKASNEQSNSAVDTSVIQDLDVNLCSMQAETLNFWLTKFVMEVCKEDGECYPPRTLYSICCGIQRHLCECNGVSAIAILDKKDKRFATFRRALDGEMKQANYEGIGNKCKRSERVGITEDEERMLWDKGFLGCHNAKVLMHTIYFYNGKLFGIRSKEHRDLRYGNFRVDSSTITFDESSSKTYHGGLQDLKYTPRVVNHICCPSEKAKHFRCLVSCYKKYLECIKPLSEKIEAFYFRPNRDSAKFCYEYAPVGINSLNKILPDELCKGAGVTRKTSHNLRVSCATALFQNSVEEKLIRERTGHRSNALFKYEKASLEQQRKVGDILGPPAALDVNELRGEDAKEADFLFDDFDIPDDILCNIPIPGDRPIGSDSNTVSESFTRSVFNNCTINFVSK